MKPLARSAMSVAVSILFNVGMLALLLLVQRALPSIAKELELESIFTEEMPQEEITRELDLQTAPAETLNVIAGGTPSSTVGASAQPAADAVNVQKASVM